MLENLMTLEADGISDILTLSLLTAKDSLMLNLF